MNPDDSSRTLFYRGVSMRRTFRVGDLLQTRPVEFNSIRVGDVVTFVANDSGRMIVHRVVAIRHGKIITQGDNNPYSDPPVASNQDVRRVLGVIRKGRFRQIASGRAGKLLFYVHQFRRISRNMVSFFFRPILERAPLRFLTPLLGPLKLVSYIDRDILFLRDKKLAIRSKEKNAPWRILDATWRLFFSAKRLDIHFPHSFHDDLDDFSE